jgi:1,4-dihydroxy-6-naphthoate synthase
MRLRLGFSSCPNDTFIFEALINKRLESNGIEFDVYIADVEELNEMAERAVLDITKISYRSFFDVQKSYGLLRTGGALGKGCGPLLIARKDAVPKDIYQASIAIPGTRTTANFLLNYAYPGLKNVKPFLFSDIERAVVEGTVDAGVIIHENRFTYQNKGLVEIKDLGEHWEMQTKAPIPLGAIVIKRSLGSILALKINSLIRESIEMAFEQPSLAKPYIKSLASEMDDDVLQAHINLYVNDFSLDIGKSGEMAISAMRNETEGIRETADLFAF